MISGDIDDCLGKYCSNIEGNRVGMLPGKALHMHPHNVSHLVLSGLLPGPHQGLHLHSTLMLRSEAKQEQVVEATKVIRPSSCSGQ